MPKDKDLKRLVRDRMERTGESYSIARLQVVGDNQVARAAAPARKRADGVARPPRVYQVKITIDQIEPPIWRRLQVPADITLPRFHDAIQAAFGWWDYHLHQFIVDGLHFGVPDPEFIDELPMIDESNVKLQDLQRASKIVYQYDFGDCWDHRVEIESLSVDAEPDVRYPICTGGERARPPEDCGGTSGYEHLLEVLGNPHDEEYREVKTWVGRAFHPEKFDLRAVNRALRKASGDSRTTRLARATKHTEPADRVAVSSPRSVGAFTGDHGAS
jgi:hypothetical protein